MRDARLFELITADGEAERFIKGHRVNLGVEAETLVSALPRRLHRGREERPAYSAPPPRGPHRHASDPSLWEEACRTDGAAVKVAREEMDRDRIVLIDLDLFGHALLDHKNLATNLEQLSLRGVPGDLMDGEKIGHGSSALRSDQFPHRLVAVHEEVGTSREIFEQDLIGVDPELMIDRGKDFAEMHAAIGDLAAEPIGRPDHLTGA